MGMSYSIAEVYADLWFARLRSVMRSCLQRELRVTQHKLDRPIHWS